MAFTLKSKLPRLSREHYQGRAFVLWTHTFENRATGWLCDSFHLRFREILVHTGGRYRLATACYVLMPDHWHVVWIGLDVTSDQFVATSFLRKHLRRFLGPAALQDRAHDHVLRETERERGAFESTCADVLQNPGRANLVPHWREWPHLVAVVNGYPDLDPRAEDFWSTFWKIHNHLVDPCAHAQGYGKSKPRPSQP